MNADKLIQRKSRWRTDRLPWYPKRLSRNEFGRMFRKLNYTLGAEIGTMKGLFAETLCLANPDLRLICVDPWSFPPYSKFYNEAVKRLEKYNVTIVRKTSMEAVKQCRDGSLDFVYIDGNHLFDYVMMDLICWAPKVRKGGIIALHDYIASTTDVLSAVDAYTRCHDIRPWYVTREWAATAFWVQR